jgi:hypothetical protein
MVMKQKYILLTMILFVFFFLFFATSLALIPGDFGSANNGPPDGVVDFEDLMIFAMAYGSTPSDSNWNSLCDIAGQGSTTPDGVIDFEDLMIFAMHYGENVSDEWLSIENEFFIIKYRSGYENDAEKILEYANFARPVVMEKFPHNLAQKVVIYLYKYSEYQYEPYEAMANYSKGEIYLLTPSDQSVAGSCSEWCDDLWYQKVVIHEYAHIPFLRDLDLQDSPAWFSEGFAEYIAVFFSTSSILQKYEGKLSKIKNMVKNGDGYLVSVGEDVYYGGAYIVKYMYEVYGQDKVVNLIKSNALSFSQAIIKELNVTSIEFEDKWLKWACKEFDADYEQLYAPE